jgi:hypothetical protein
VAFFGFGRDFCRFLDIEGRWKYAYDPFVLSILPNPVCLLDFAVLGRGGGNDAAADGGSCCRQLRKILG